VAASAGFRRAAALGLLVLVLAALWRFGALPLWRAWQEDRDTVERLGEQLVRLQTLARARDDFARALDAARAASGLAGALMVADSPTLAAAQLQQTVKSLVEAAGGSVVSSQPTEAVPAGPYTRIGLDVRMLLGIEALQRVLHELEGRRPVLVVGEMLILSRTARRTRRGEQAGEAPLDVRLQVEGFLEPREPRRAG